LVMILSWIGIIVVGIAPLLGAQQASTPASPYRAVLNRYCVTCHNEKLKTAGLMLDKMDVDKVAEGAPAWEKVVRKLRSGAMPPAGAPRPDKFTYDSFATYLETALNRAAAAQPNPGSPTIHRMNRAEFTNAVRDLLAIDPDSVDIGSLLPPDDSGYGFDNIGDVLSVSPVLLERYMSAARKMSRLAVGDAAIRPDFATYDVPRFLLQKDRISEALPFGSRGGIAIRHYFPLDGEYVIKVQLKRNYNGQNILGLAEQNQLDLRLDGARVKLFTVGGKGAAPPRPAGPDREEFAGPISDQRRATRESSNLDADADLEVRLPIKAGTRLVGVSFLKGTWAIEDVLKPLLAASEVESNELPSVGRVTIGGPYAIKGSGETPSRRKIFSCRPTESEPRPAPHNPGLRTPGRPKGSGPLANDDESCAKKILSALAHLAYRRPITDADTPILLRPYKEGRDTKGNEGGFEAGIEMAVQRILVSPEFLFRIERDPAGVAPGTPYRISDLELASRLSFFLWSSIPDEQLLDLAERGKLKDSEVLQQQVKRMLADSRSKALVDNFAGQWLYLRNVRSALPDLAEYPDFDENLRDALQKETELFFESMLREDHSVLDLLNANYTYVNERLARHYGIPNVYGSHFRRVALADENRRGLLGQGSILLVTSYANRTSPTLRGKWLLDNLLGAPPPPPPPNVPSLKDRGADGKILSMRQQMEAHRANPACAVCHKMMDPLGFALENFDAVGQWRSTSGAKNIPIDSSGVLPDGTTFNGPAELRKVLLSRPQQFVTTVSEKLLTYSLGRGLEYYDEPSVRKILRETAASDYRWSALILGIVKSDPFQMRRVLEP